MSFEWVEKNASNYENKRNITTKMNILEYEESEIRKKKIYNKIFIFGYTLFIFKSLPKKYYIYMYIYPCIIMMM